MTHKYWLCVYITMAAINRYVKAIHVPKHCLISNNINITSVRR